MMAMLTYIYPNGTFYLGPTFPFWNSYHSVEQLSKAVLADKDGMAKDQMQNRQVKRRNLHKAALGTHYVETYEKKHPRLIETLQDRMTMILIGNSAVTADFIEGQGTARLIIAALMACLSAKRDLYTHDQDVPPRERKFTDQPNRNTIEVDLFIRQRVKPGASIRASAGHMNSVNKGLHDVGAHYAYRKRADGSDPTICHTSETSYHDFEEVPGTKSEVCILCHQKRWFRETHQRGDEAYGIVPRKVMNVRQGGDVE